MKTIYLPDTKVQNEDLHFTFFLGLWSYNEWQEQYGIGVVT